MVSWRRDTPGDGFYTRFDGPARAIRCALYRCGGVGDDHVCVQHGGCCFFGSVEWAVNPFEEFRTNRSRAR